MADRTFVRLAFWTAIFGLVAPPGVAGATPRICAASGGLQGRLSYGVVHFANSCKAAVQPALQLQIAKLHSFEADASGFVAVAARDPGCAIAWWGAAMAARGNPIGDAVDAKTLKFGHSLVDHAAAIKTMTPREEALVEAMDVYYRPYRDQMTRARAYAGRMDALHKAYPDDPDIGAFDGLAIIEGVDLNDKTYSRQKRAGAVLEAVMKAHPENPGAPHYLIHAFDFPALAPGAIRAAEVYPTLATASSHAQHMPAHIWSMLGAWDKSIAANRRSGFVADAAVANGPVAGDIVFEHAFDFIAYARLQKGEDRHVGADLAASQAKKDMPTVVAARYALERDDWGDAARFAVPDDVFDAVLAHFTRGYGAARAGKIDEAKQEIEALRALHDPIAEGAGAYWAQSDDIYVEAVQAWILKAEGKDEAALAAMREAARADDAHGKHIYLENKLLPMRESLADMELALQKPLDALTDYEASLTLAPNRYRSFAGAARAAEAAGDLSAARDWWTKLSALAKDGDHARPADAEAKAQLSARG